MRRKIITSLLFRKVAQIEVIGTELFFPFNLTVKQFAILMKIHENITTSRQLQSLWGGKKSAMAHILKQLEEKKFITRKIDKDDKRVWHFSTTKKGVVTIELVLPIYKKSIEKIYKNVSETELDQLESILQKINL